MEFWKDVRREVLTNELSQRTACRKYGLGWHTLKKILTRAEPPGWVSAEPASEEAEAGGLSADRVAGFELPNDKLDSIDPTGKAREHVCYRGVIRSRDELVLWIKVIDVGSPTTYERVSTVIHCAEVTGTTDQRIGERPSQKRVVAATAQQNDGYPGLPRIQQIVAVATFEHDAFDRQ